MFQTHLGELAALVTVCCWTASAHAFQKASRNSGSMPVNWIRLVVGLVLFCIFLSFKRGMPVPLDASADAWIWLSLSGVIGFGVDRRNQESRTVVALAHTVIFRLCQTTVQGV